MGAAFSPKTPLAIKRGNRRRRVTAPAFLLTGTGRIDAKLHDVSKAGALAEASQPPIRGSSVVLAFGGCVVPALVAWVAGRRFGLEFDQWLSDEQILELNPVRRL